MVIHSEDALFWDSQKLKLKKFCICQNTREVYQVCRNMENPPMLYIDVFLLEQRDSDCSRAVSLSVTRAPFRNVMTSWRHHDSPMIHPKFNRPWHLFFFAWKCHGKFCMSPQVLWMINSWVFGLDKELNQELIIFRSCIHSFSFFFLKVSKRHHIMLPKSFASWWCWLSTHLEKKDVQVKFGSFPKFHNFETFT